MVHLLLAQEIILPLLNKNNIPLEIKASNTSAMLENDDRYKYILFKNYKKEINYKNLKYFPIIKILLKKYNSIKTCFFSIMDHKKIIPYLFKIHNPFLNVKYTSGNNTVKPINLPS